MEIAVFQGINGKTQSFLEPGIVKVYSGRMEEWKVTKEIIFRIDNITSLKMVREKIKNMVEALGDCKIFVGSEVKGIPYNVLDGMGFNTWELEGNAKDFLKFVFDKEEEEAKSVIKANKENKVSLIQKVKDGNYFLNLKKIQENDVNLTSKTILLPFLKSTTFYELQILCNHVPPWFEAEFERLNLKTQRQVLGQNEIRVTVFPKACSV